MLKTLQFNDSKVKSLLYKCDYQSLADYLKSSFKLERSPNGGATIKYSFDQSALNSLEDLLKIVVKLDPSEKNTSIIFMELFRALRNYCVNEDTQSYLTNQQEFIEDVNSSITKISASGNNKCLQIILQFMINLIVLNPQGSKVVFNKFSSQILSLLQQKMCVYESSALLHNIALHNSIADLGFDLYSILFSLYADDSELEFIHFLLEKILEYDNFWENYKLLDLKQRITSLELIRHHQIKDINYKLSEVAIRTLATEFSNSSSVIFQTVTSNTSENNLEPYEVSLLLEVLASLCGDEESLKILQTDKNFLINTGVVLINIHRLGKTSENYFSSIQRLSEVTEPNEVIKNHPAFGFKLGLVRIIGNMCWKNPTMQDLVREAELIPIILDGCNMDARNPFIMQWVILAIRNLCDGNHRNQSVIAGLRQEGTVSSSTLEEMGLTLHGAENNSIKIVPLDSLRK